MITKAPGRTASDADKDSEKATADRGTSAAQHTGTMQTLCETDENACLAEQNLPCSPAAFDATK
jgi:hypothetical protein